MSRPSVACTGDYVLEMPYAKPDPVRVEGLATVQAYLRAAFETFRFELTITESWEIPGGVVAEYTSEGTVVSTGKRYANTYIGVWRFRDGLVSHTREYYDPIVAAEAFQ
jgi:uncharacterized protein